MAAEHAIKQKEKLMKNANYTISKTKTGATVSRLQTRSDWAKERGLRPNAAQTRRDYAQWAQSQTAAMAETLTEETKGMEIARVSRLKSGNITVSYRKPAKVPAGSAKVISLADALAAIQAAAKEGNAKAIAALEAVAGQ